MEPPSVSPGTPSANPPQAPPPVVKKPTGRKPGGQPEHPAHLRARLPAERLTEPIMHYLPKVCEASQHKLPTAAGPDDPEPHWHQTVELPEYPVQIAEHQAHARTCPCGHVTWAQIPQEKSGRCWTSCIGRCSPIATLKKRRNYFQYGERLQGKIVTLYACR